MDLTYWAAKPTGEIAKELIAKCKQYYMYLQQSGRLALYKRSYDNYYGPGQKGGQAAYGGQVGELVLIGVNHYRAYLKRLLTLTTSQRPAFECRASNTDHKSQAQCILGQSLVDYYLREKKLEIFLKQATEYGLLYAEGFISVLWNPTEGEQYGVDPETGAVIYQGEIAYRAFGPMDLVRDFTKDSPFNHNWAIPVEWQNKYELAARFPELAEKILNINDVIQMFDGVDTFRTSRQIMYGTFESDEIPVFTFFHKASDALPQGRMTQFLPDETVLFDGPIPYRDVPIYRVSCSEWLGTPFGYSTGYDLMPLQDMTDSLHSTVCTNQNAFGVQNIWSKAGDTPSETNLAGGLRLLHSEVKPEPLQLTSTAPETFKYMADLKGEFDLLSGMNPVVMGNPERDMSGSAMALLTSNAIQFSMDLQQSYAKLLEDCGTATLERLRVFAKVPRVAAIAGKSKRQYMQEFVGDDISTVNRVLVDVGNPARNTLAFNMSMAKDLMEMGVLKTAEEYIMVVTTGRVEPMYEYTQSELMNIRRENELITEGQLPAALITDNPVIHIKEHATVGNSPEARSNPQIMQNYTQHIQEHIELWRTMDPVLAGMLGIPPPPPLVPNMPASPGEPNTQQQPQGSGNPGPSPEAALDAQNPATQKAEKVKQPKQPNLPPGTPARMQESAQQMPVMQ